MCFAIAKMKYMKKNKDIKDLGFNLKVERMRQGLSQEQLAEMADLSNYQHISKIEKGDVDMRVSTLVKILRALKLKFEDLIEL